MKNSITNKQWIIRQLIVSALLLGIYFLIYTLKGGWFADGKEVKSAFVFALFVSGIFAILTAFIKPASFFAVIFIGVVLISLIIESIVVLIITSPGVLIILLVLGFCLSTIIVIILAAILAAIREIFFYSIEELAEKNNELSLDLIHGSLILEFVIIAGAMNVIWVF